LTLGITCWRSSGPTEISPVNGRLYEAISNTARAMPVENRVMAMAHVNRLSLCTMAIGNQRDKGLKQQNRPFDRAHGLLADDDALATRIERVPQRGYNFTLRRSLPIVSRRVRQYPLHRLDQ
jgi:hypothetical protein